MRQKREALRESLLGAFLGHESGRAPRDPQWGEGGTAAEIGLAGMDRTNTLHGKDNGRLFLLVTMVCP